MRPSDERTDWLAQNVFPHERSIRAWLKRRIALGLDIDDVIHEMYAKLIAMASVAQIKNPKRYAFRIAYGIVVDHIRHTGVVPMTPLSEESEFSLGSGEPSIEDQLVQRSDLQDVDAVLQTLPRLCREAFLLRRVEGLSQRETAARLKISERTVEKYMTRSVRLIMDVFGRGGKKRSYPSYQSEDAQSFDAKNRGGY